MAYYLAAEVDKATQPKFGAKIIVTARLTVKRELYPVVNFLSAPANVHVAYKIMPK